MTYTKPQFTVVANAIEAVHASDAEKCGNVQDGQPIATSTAYQADE